MISEFRAQLDFTRVTNSEPIQDLRICVCVRKRPINKKGIPAESLQINLNIIELHLNNNYTY